MPKKIIRAIVKPEILIWARESAGFSIAEVSSSSGLSKAADWEDGTLQPTINQLRTLARKYKRPLAVFYLQEVPKTKFETIKDFRRLPGDGLLRLSPKLHMEIRSAQERRNIALEMLDEIDDQQPSFPLSAKLDDDPEVVGNRLRKHIGVSDTLQRSWRNKRDAFNAWRSLIEASGVLVFQMDKVPTSEASGFALSQSKLPVVAVNRADVVSRRTFSLFHELAHIVLHRSGVSEFYVDVSRPPEEQRVEVWCNAVAAAVIIPKNMILDEPIVRNHPSSVVEWSEDSIDELSDIFSVSRVSIVRRLLTLGLTDNSFYKLREQQYAAEYSEFLAKKKADFKDREFGGRNMPVEAVSLLGRNYIQMVLTSYNNNKITLRDVSAYLNLKTRHIPGVENAILRGVGV